MARARARLDAAAAEAAAEAGEEAVTMKGTREEIIARLRKFDWEPKPEDVAYVAKATEAAKAENLIKNETVGGKVFFSEHVEDINTAANTEMYQALIDEINHAQKIHAALYGIDSVPELTEALRAAKARGAEIRIVVDQNPDGTFTYPETEKLIEEFGPDCFRVERNSKYAIMHDKFWIFDDRKVWSGSTNINRSAIGKGYNNEISVLMESKNLAKQFEAEHAQMWAGKFHKQKVDNTEENLPPTADGVSAQVFFSPTDNAIEEGIIPAIEEAKESIHLQLFHFSHPDIAKAILDAKARGVDVKLIIDATGAANKATMKNVELLRAAGIPVKVENWGGKQHMKGGVIDGQTAIFGSMNWTEGGLKRNDENCIVVKGHKGLGAAMEKNFDGCFKNLPDITLFGYFSAEGLNSIGTMTDGSDNDHFGGKDPLLSWNNYQKARAEIDTAAQKMAAVQGPEAALKAKAEALRILQGEVNKAKARLQQSQGTKADLVIRKIDEDLAKQIASPSL
jgi:phosphatidylserine/phosphatidylglycerophosphate/cardiolipin synthase-like enzyme